MDILVENDEIKFGEETLKASDLEEIKFGQIPFKEGGSTPGLEFFYKAGVTKTPDLFDFPMDYPDLEPDIREFAVRNKIRTSDDNVLLRSQG